MWGNSESPAPLPALCPPSPTVCGDPGALGCAAWGLARPAIPPLPVLTDGGILATFRARQKRAPKPPENYCGSLGEGDFFCYANPPTHIPQNDQRTATII